MIGTSAAEYIFIQACILFLHYISPISVFYCLLLFLHLLSPVDLSAYRVPLPIEAWLLTEAAFFIVFFLPYRYYLQRSTVHPELISREERKTLFQRCNDSIEDPDQYLKQWFLGAKREQIKRDNVKDFFAWAFLDRSHVSEKDESELEDYTNGLEKILGRDLPPGKGNARSLKLTLGRVDCLHRSLLWYLCVAVVDTKTCCTLLYHGFHLHRTSLLSFFTLFPLRPLNALSSHKSPAAHLTYWHRAHKSKSKLPVLFIHGIGIGLYPYTNFLRDMNSGPYSNEDDSQIGIIAIEIMPISFRLTHPALEKDVMVDEIHKILNHHGWSKFTLVSHSYGSAIATHLIKSPLTAPLVGPIVFIDPISFLLHLPDVAYNFTFRKPSRANEHQLWYFASKDIGVAHTLARTFFWSQNVIWKEDLGLEGSERVAGRDVTVTLSAKDLIVNTKAVRRYLASSTAKRSIPSGEANGSASWNDRLHLAAAPDAGSRERKSRPSRRTGMNLLWYEDLDHAQVFDVASTRRPIVDAIRSYSVSL